MPNDMPRVIVNQSRGLPLAAGAAALGLAMSLRRGSMLRLPLTSLGFASLGIAGLGSGLLRNGQEAALRATGENGAAPELVRSAVVDGILMRWEEHGPPDGIPVVMLHGIPTGPRLWRHVVPHLTAAGFRCLAWEMVGYAWSMAAGQGRDVSLRAQARYLAAWLDHLGIEVAVFLGHDLGGGVLQRLLAEAPDRVAGLVLTDCVAYDNWPVTPVATARAMAGMIASLPPAVLKPIFLAGLLDLGHDNEARRVESAALHWEPYSRSIGPTAFAHQVRHLDASDTQEVAPALAQGVRSARVVWGDADPLGMQSAERLAADLKAPLERIPGGRHFTPEDHPERIAAAVQAVVAELRQAAGVAG